MLAAGWLADCPARGALLVETSAWTDETLAAALDERLRELHEIDRAQGLTGRDSHHFDFHDSGLGWIAETLDERLDEQRGR